MLILSSRKSLISFVPVLSSRFCSAQASLAEQKLLSAKPFEVIPGPRNSFQFLKLMAHPKSKYYNQPLIKMICMIREDFGDLVYFPGLLGAKPMVMTFSPEDAEKVSRYEGRYPYRRDLETFKYYRKQHRPELFKPSAGLVVEHGLAWHEFRSKVNQVMLHPRNVKMYTPILDNVACEFVEKIRAIRNESMTMPDNFLENLNEWALESIALIALDTRLNLFEGANQESKQLYELIKEMFAIGFEFDIKPSIWRYCKTPGFNKALKTFDKLTQIVFGHVGQAVERYEKSPSASEHQSILEKLLKIDRNVAEVMATDMLIAGIDTTSSTAAAALYCLATNPDKQEILRKEVKKVLPSNYAQLTEKSLASVPYMRAVIKEALRMFPIFNGIARALDKDIVLQGYRIKKGVDIMMVPTAYSDFEHTNKFIPERWLKRKTQKTCQGKDVNPFAHLPFGYGPRMCIGKRMAEMEIEILLTRLLSEFKLEWQEGDIKWSSTTINVPSSPLRFKVLDL
ncbi:unnamed protein product [Chironomus riparius]|uniref:Cytochrome P450 n=1 Tax=Chironomus riparius TaxID=315576 RepID=A0A9N9WPP6_9DIPT|nr:unnamed protein product [Chironomus riparius]